MTTAELITLLQQEDPEGTAEVCVGTAPVWCVEKLPYYYDGRLEFVERRNGVPVRAGWRDEGVKVRIRTDDVESAIYDNPTVEIVMPPSEQGRRAEWIEKTRTESFALRQS